VMQVIHLIQSYARTRSRKRREVEQKGNTKEVNENRSHAEADHPPRDGWCPGAEDSGCWDHWVARSCLFCALATLRESSAQLLGFFKKYQHLPSCCRVRFTGCRTELQTTLDVATIGPMTATLQELIG